MRAGAFIASFLLGAILAAGPIRAAEGPDPAAVLLLFPFENRGTGLSADALEQFTDYLGAKLAEVGGYRLIPSASVKSLLDQGACLDRPCQQDAGRILGAGFHATARLGQIGGLCIVTVSLYRADDAVALRTSTERSACDPEALLGALDVAAVKLTARRIHAKPIPPDVIPPEPPAPHIQPRHLPDGTVSPPAPNAQARPVAAGPDGRPQGPPPRTDDRPRTLKRPAGPPPQAVPEPPRKPKRFLSLAFLYSSDYLSGSDAFAGSGQGSGFLGSRAAFDWQLGDWFLLGVGFSGLVGESASTAEVNARFGASFPLAERFALLALAEGGLSALTPAADNTMTGVSAGLSLAGRLMLSANFGLLFELGMAMQVVEDRAAAASESLLLWRIQSSLGLVVGW